MSIVYAREPELSAGEFAALLEASGLAARRPADPARLQAMLEGADLTVTARDGDGALVGVARCVTDWAYCLYCSDLAVARAHQGRGIGKQLLARVVAEAPGVGIYLLLSAPGAVGFYERAGYERHPAAFVFHRNG